MRIADAGPYESGRGAELWVAAGSCSAGALTGGARPALAHGGARLCFGIGRWEDRPMCDRGQDGLQARIEVVLHEYDALHDEIVSRMEARFQLVGFLAIAGTKLY